MFVNLTNFLENSSGVLGALEIHTDPHLVHTITCFQRVCVCVCEWRQPRTLWWRAACWEHHLCEGVNLFTSRKQISNLLFCSPIRHLLWENTPSHIHLWRQCELYCTPAFTRRRNICVSTHAFRNIGFSHLHFYTHTHSDRYEGSVWGNQSEAAGRGLWLSV